MSGTAGQTDGVTMTNTNTGTRASMAVVLLVVITVACQRSDASHATLRTASRSTDAVVTHQSLAHASGDSVMIRTTDGAINLGLARDTVFMGLSDSVLALARTDMTRDTEETKSAFAGALERFVKKSVSSALQTRLKYPLTDLDSATYSGGAIKFAYRDRRSMAFEDVSQNGHKALQSFSPTDAQRFVATVNSAIRTARGSLK